MGELLAAILDVLNPKTRSGKVIVGVLGAAVLVFAVLELLAAFER